MKKSKIAIAALISVVAVTAAVLLGIWLMSRSDSDTEKDKQSDRGLVEIVLAPSSDSYVTGEKLDAAQEVIERRLHMLEIYDCNVTAKDSTIVVKINEKPEGDPEEIAEKLCETAELTFRKGAEVRSEDWESYIEETGEIISGTKIVPQGEIIADGNDVKSAHWAQTLITEGLSDNVVVVEFYEEGTAAFADATTELAGTETPISIWVDSELISAPLVSEAITTGETVISGNFTEESAKELADKISSGSLPFNMEIKSIDKT